MTRLLEDSRDDLQAAVLYDSDCGFCRWSIAVIGRWDRRHRVRPVAIQSAEGERLLADMKPELRLDSFHFAEPDGTIVSAGRAAAPLLRRLPGGGPPAALADRLPGLAERTYRLVANRRSFFGRLLRRFNAIPPPPNSG